MWDRPQTDKVDDYFTHGGWWLSSYVQMRLPTEIENTEHCLHYFLENFPNLVIDSLGEGRGDIEAPKVNMNIQSVSVDIKCRCAQHHLSS